MLSLLIKHGMVAKVSSCFCCISFLSVTDIPPMLQKSPLCLDVYMNRGGFPHFLKRHKHHPFGKILYNEISKPYVHRDCERWWLLDATGMQMPFLAKTVSHYVQGHHRVDFEQGKIMGDHVVVINCKDAVMVGEEWIRVPIRWETKYPSGRYSVRCADMYDKDPCMVVWHFLRREIVERGWNRKEHLMQGHMEKAWLYTDHIHPHMDKDPRPVPWSDHNPHYYAWTSERARTGRWDPNPQMR